MDLMTDRRDLAGRVVQALVSLESDRRLCLRDCE
jgi:hypothetical protein